MWFQASFILMPPKQRWITSHDWRTDGAVERTLDFCIGKSWRAQIRREVQSTQLAVRQCDDNNHRPMMISITQTIINNRYFFFVIDSKHQRFAAESLFHFFVLFSLCFLLIFALSRFRFAYIHFMASLKDYCHSASIRICPSMLVKRAFFFRSFLKRRNFHTDVVIASVFRVRFIHPHSLVHIVIWCVHIISLTPPTSGMNVGNNGNAEQKRKWKEEAIQKTKKSGRKKWKNAWCH